jgi:SlyX protein
MHASVLAAEASKTEVLAALKAYGHSAMAAPESRLVDLELRFMKLERFAQDLSDVIADQGRKIDALTHETKRLREQLSQDDGEALPSERPPHY